MANRFPIIIDTNDNNRLKELPNGDSLDLANGGVRNAQFIETASLIIAGANFVPFSRAYADLTGTPTIATDISSLTDSQNLLTGTSFSTITSKPTTLSGYGITDAFNGTYAGLTGAPNLAPIATTGSFNSLTAKPTTLAGYGITDALTGSSLLKNLADVHTVVPTDGQLLSWDNSNSYWKPITASGTGTVTSVVAGSGLTGGTITGAGTIAVDVGTTANKIVQLDASAKLPGVDGSSLYNIYVSSLSNIGDTTITSPTNGQVLKYNGTNWFNATNDGSGGSITFVGDDSTGTAVDGSETFKIAGGTNITTAVSGDTLTINATAITKAQVSDLLNSDFDVGTNKILYSNVYATEGDLPTASSYHGMFAHVHATGAGYFAHGGAWIKLANNATTLAGYGITDGYANTNVDAHLNQAGSVTTGYVLSWNGSDYAWVAQSGGGASIGNFTFASSVVDTDDSSGITITPSVTISSDLTVENDLVVNNKITATEFVSLSAGTPEIRSATTLDLYAIGAVRIQNGALRLFNATTTVRDTLSPAKGDVVYNSTVNRTQVYTGAAWVSNALSTDIPTSTSQLTNGAGFATLASPTFTGTVSGISSTMVGLSNVTNESKSSMFTDPTFTGTVGGVTKQMVGLSNATNESKATMFTSPTFTGTIAGSFGGTVENSFNITASGSSDYVFAADSKFFTANANDPVLYLRRGETYKFIVNASGHPFQIRVSNGGSAYNTGVTNNGQSNATITFIVPMTAPATLYYQCTAHSGMGAVINIV
jgi:hypothetical protein